MGSAASTLHHRDRPRSASPLNPPHVAYALPHRDPMNRMKAVQEGKSMRAGPSTTA